MTIHYYSWFGKLRKISVQTETLNETLIFMWKSSENALNRRDLQKLNLYGIFKKK